MDLKRPVLRHILIRCISVNLASAVLALLAQAQKSGAPTDALARSRFVECYARVLHPRLGNGAERVFARAS